MLSLQQLKRREFLRVGGLAPFGLSLPAFLAGRADAAQTSESARPKSNKAVILIWLFGAPSHLDTFDMKPGAPSEVRGPFQPIETVTPGIEIGELLPCHARVMDRLSLIRSVSHFNAQHQSAYHHMITGFHGGPFPVKVRNPSVGSIISKCRGPNAADMPAYVCVPDLPATTGAPPPAYHGAAYLGAGHNPLSAGGDPNRRDYQFPNLQLSISPERLNDRRQLSRALDRMSRSVETISAAQSLDRFQQQAADMVLGKRAREAFDLQNEKESVRDRYGRHTWGQSALLARRLVESGVTFVNVKADTSWDDHSQIESQMRKRVPPMDQAVGTLVEDLADRGMWDDVLVLVMGEFGRTPKMNPQAGRDHWAAVFSMAMGGGGLKGGQILGSSTSKGDAVKDRPVSPGDILHTIYHVMGIDPTTHFTNNAGRPIPIIGHGKPISELI